MGGLVKTGHLGWIGRRWTRRAAGVTLLPPNYVSGVSDHGFNAYPVITNPWFEVGINVPSGANRLAIVFVSVINKSNTNGEVGDYVVTLDGDTMTQSAKATRSFIHHSVHYRAIGSSGSGGVRDIRVTFDNLLRSSVMVHGYTFSNAMQAAPIVTTRSGNVFAPSTAPVAFNADVQENNSIVINSLSVDDDRVPAAVPTGHTRRHFNRTIEEYLEDYNTDARVMATATKLHPTSGTNPHEWWWTGSSMGYTWLAAEVRPFGT